MPTSMFRQALSTVEELTITATGHRSRQKISLPVWFSQTLQLLPVQGSDSDWYKNVVHTPAIRLAAKRATITATAKPVTEATKGRKIVEQFRAKYGAAKVKKYFVKFDVGVDVRLPSPPPRPGWAPAGRRVQRSEVRAGAVSPQRAGFFIDSLDPPIHGRRHRATIIFHLRPRP